MRAAHQQASTVRLQVPSSTSAREPLGDSRSLATSRFLSGALEPCPHEGDFSDLTVDGQLPAELSGTLFRVGPNPRYIPRGGYHPFFADGMVYAFGFGRGRASFRNRWIRTRRFLLEQRAGRSLFDGFGNYVGGEALEAASPETQLAVLSGQNTANTNILSHGSSLLALSEAGLPYQVDGRSLETVGPFDFGRTLKRSMTGHPKIDPHSGNLLGFSYGMSAPFLVFYEYDPSGKLVRSVDIPTPFPSMVHDFAVTDRFVVFPIFPVTMRASRLRSTGSPFGWEPDLGTHVAVLARTGDPEMRWFVTDPAYAFHLMNGFDVADHVVLDLVRYDAFPDYFTEHPTVPNSACLVRWTIDLRLEALRQVKLSDTRLEMPQIDSRFVGRPYRHGYANGGFRKGMFHSIEHFDTVAGTHRSLDLGDGVVAFEPVVVPRSATAAEADGFVLALVGSEAGPPRTDLLVLDAQRIDNGPLATVRLPHRVNGHFHGCWVSEDHHE
ncbi:MAG: carotenoid oxygenase family protein [Deltaproteobacteria bacterium]